MMEVAQGGMLDLGAIRKQKKKLQASPFKKYFLTKIPEEYYIY